MRNNKTKQYKRFWTTLIFLISSVTYLMAQHTVEGKITDASGQPVVGAYVRFVQQNDSTKYAISDRNGNYKISGIISGEYKLRASTIGLMTHQQIVNIAKDEIIPILLAGNNLMLNEVVVQATRAASNTPTTYTNVSKQDIATQNLGQDLPYLLNYTPSVVVTSDAGAGVGYTGIRIRGSDPTRVNVTINGVAINDAESQGSFLVNLPDLASSVDNIQIQRGVGTSTNGAGAFGASLNIQTDKLTTDAYGEVNNSYGSFNTWKNTVKAGTGLINNHYVLEARLSNITSSGYMDRATSDLKSYFVSGGYYGAKTIIKFLTFSGKEKTYQAWNGVPQDSLKTNRTYNQFDYANQTDNYLQTHYQLHITHAFTNKLNFSTTFHNTLGKGYYEEYKQSDDFSKYNIAPMIIGTDTITQSDLIRRRWLDNDYYGATFSLNYSNLKNVQATIGGALNEYKGAHYGEVVWSKYAVGVPIDYRYYRDDALKNDFNIYGRVTYNPIKALGIWLDMQYRSVYYSFLGYNRTLQNVQQSVRLNFFNPKVGFSYQFDRKNFFYASYSVGNKEPNRDDYTQSTPDSRPKAETLNNIEIGYKYNSVKSAIEINLYDMDYKNQLVSNGSINDVGAYNRVNVDKSYRRGIELNVQHKLNRYVGVGANTTFSINKIVEFKEYLDDYDNGGQQLTVYNNKDIAFSPNTIVAGQLFISPTKNVQVIWSHKYVGKQYLDNTQNDLRKLNAYYVSDLRLVYDLYKVLHIKNIELNIAANNIFNKLYESNGYTYGWLYNNKREDNNFYYPQAGRNYLMGLCLKF